MIKTILYISLFFLFINIIQLFFLAHHLLREKKKKTIALILDKDKKTLKSIKVFPSERTFKHDFQNKTYEYNLTEPFIKYINTNILLYELGKADPINPLDKQNSRLDADTYNAILENEILIKLNKGENLLSNLLTPRNLLIAGAVILVILFLTGTIEL